MKSLKRILAWVLCAALLCSMFPQITIPAAAEEQPVLTEAAPPETAPAEAPEAGETEAPEAEAPALPEGPGAAPEPEPLPAEAPARAGAPARPASEVGSGSCGENVFWSVSDEGVLTISGTGPMADYASPNELPYGGEDVSALVVEEGVTALGTNAFNGFLLEGVWLPESLQAIGTNAFKNTAVAEAHFAGNIKQWNDGVSVGSGNGALTEALVCDAVLVYEADGLHLTGDRLRVDYEAKNVWENNVQVSRNYSVPVPDSFKTEYDPYVRTVEYAPGTEIISDYSLRSMTGPAILEIPEGLIGIEQEAFRGCTGLTEVHFPESLTRIYYAAFEDCTGLTRISLPDSIAELRDSAFYGCTGLTEVRLPAGLTRIPGYCFYNCSALREIELPEAVTEIQYGAFYNCASLTRISLPAGLRSVGSSAFYGCTGLQAVEIRDLAAWCGVAFDDGWANPLGYAHSLILNGVPVEQLVIPEGVTEIKNDAFYRCDVQSLTVPDTVTAIGDSAFLYCSRLAELELPNSLRSIGKYAFAYTALRSLELPDSVSDLGSNAFCWCQQLESAALPGSLTALSPSLFQECGQLKEISIPDSVTQIGDGAFNGTPRLADVWYDGTEAMWQEIAVGSYNSDLQRATVHYAAAGGVTGEVRWVLSADGTLKLVGQGRMADYGPGEAPWTAWSAQITRVSVRPRIKNLGAYALAGLPNLSAVEGMEGVSEMGEGALRDCPALRSVTLPAGLGTMGPEIFAGCTGLDTLGPAGSGAALEIRWARAIPANAFAGAEGLRSASLPEGLTRLNAGAFRDCSGLETLELPDSLVTVQEDAFHGCASLAEVTLPEGLRTLGARSFRGTAVETVTLPASLTTYGVGAFSACPALTALLPAEGSPFAAEDGVLFTGDMTRLLQYPAGKPEQEYSLPEGLESVAAYAFDGADAPAVLRVPGSLQAVGSNAFAVCAVLTDVYYDGVWEDWNAIDMGPDNQALTGAAIHFVSSHSHGELEFETPWNRKDALPEAPGSYYLICDVTLAQSWTVPAGGVSLCLNGFTVSGPGPVIRLGSGCSLALYDDDGEGLVLGTGSSENGGAIHVEAGTLELHGGTVTGRSTGIGGGVYIANGSFAMSGGAITGCVAGNGGSSAGGSGGGLAAVNSTVTMTGGEISHNLSDSYRAGGGVWLDNTNMTAEGNALISDNEARFGSGGGVYLTGGSTLYFIGETTAAIRDNKASAPGANAPVGFGGGVYVDAGCELHLSVDLSGNVTENGPGGGVWTAGRFDHTGGRIRNNRAEGLHSGFGGGGVYVADGGYMDQNGGDITGNHAGANGGGVCVAEGGRMYFSGASITGNSASEIYNGETFHYVGGLSCDGQLTLSGSPVLRDNENGSLRVRNAVEVQSLWAPVGIWYAEADPFTSGFSANGHSIDKFYAENPGYELVWNEDETELRLLPKTFTLRYDANGGAGEMAPQDFVFGTSQALTPNAFTLEGTFFTGWNTEADGSGTAYADEADISLSEDLTLYAQWHRHDYQAAVTEPDCTQGGFTTHSCSLCGDVYVDEETPALGHDYEAAVTEPGCLTAGYTTHTCARCGDVYTDNEIEALGHDYEAAVTEPCCTEEGYTTHTCSRCGDEYVDGETEALGHDYQTVVTEPGCLTAGYTTHTCTRCGDEYVDAETEALGHDYETQTVAPSCLEGGYVKHLCSRCGVYYLSDQSDALGHDYASTLVAPGCTEGGYTLWTCLRCGESYSENPTEPLGHSWDEGVVIDEPTETVPGRKQYSCLRCGETYIEMLPTVEHVHRYAGQTTAPSCLERGFTLYSCSCGETYVDDYVPALGHDFVNGFCVRCAEADPDYVTPVIQAQSRYGLAGAEIRVPVLIRDNPGVAGLTLKVSLGAGLELVDLAPGEILQAAQGGAGTVNLENGEFHFNCPNQVTDSGELLVLTLRVSANAVHGDRLPVDLSLKDGKAANLTDELSRPVPVNFETGWITVSRVRFGDTNTDGDVNTADAVRLAQALVNLVALTQLQSWAADVDHDGDVAASDAVKLTRALVELAELDPVNHSAPSAPRRSRSGQSSVQILVEDRSAAAGDTLEVPVRITGNPGFAGFTLALSYPDNLELQGIAKGELLESSPSGALICNLNRGLLNWNDYQNLYGNGELLRLTFTVREGTEDGFYPVRLALKEEKAANLVNADGQALQAGFRLGAVQIGWQIPCVSSSACPSVRFTDAPARGAWAHNAIDWALLRGITNGTSQNSFSPEQACTRAQVVTFLWRAAGCPVPNSQDCPFTDVPQDAYYRKAVLWAAERGITAGTSDDRFSPNGHCTRAQVVTFLWRAAGRPTPAETEPRFRDLVPGAYYETAVAWAVENGVTYGTGAETFSPSTVCTRAQVVTFLWRCHAEN